MPVIINFKICDNAKECNGIALCPTGALSWDEKKKSIKIDNKKCIGCEVCVKGCEIGAIHLAKNKTEYQKIKREIDKDPRKVSDLFVDRYGAQPIHTAFLIPEKKFQFEVWESDKLTVAELFDENSMMCLLKSIPMKELLKEYKVKYRKVETGKELMKKFKVKKLPALLFVKSGKLLGKIEGFYSKSQKDLLMKRIKSIIK